MNVLFTHSYFYKLDPKQWRFKQPYPPLGTILAAAVIREMGHRVTLCDSNLQDSPSAIIPALEMEKPDVVVIYDDGFNYLTKMCLTVMREAAFVLVQESKKRGCVVIVSSSDAADRYEQYFEHGADYVVKGEGEVTLREMIDALERKGDVHSLPGVVHANKGIVHLNPPRTVLRNLDTLPFPAWDLVDLDLYRNIWIKHHGYFSLNIATTRGCPFKCNWCAKPIYGNRYTSRSPGHVVKEIEFLLKEFRPDHFWISDDIFGLKPGWVAEFRSLITSKDLKFRFKIQSRVDLLLEDQALTDLAAAGVDTVWVGAESGSQRILDAMEKGTTVSEIYTATTRMKEKKIKVGFFLQFGYPGETTDDIDATLGMLLALMPDEVGISISYPLPGTGFYEKVKGQLRDKQNWTDSDDLMSMFESTFSSQYYKALHRYVHTVYQKHKGYQSLQKLFYDPLRLTLKEIKSGIATFYYLPMSIVKRFKLKSLELASKN